VVPAAYVVTAGTILVVLFAYRPETTWPGLAIVILGIPVYGLIRRLRARETTLGAALEVAEPE
jgi:APA family basic amino acid/polyamine antiporter